MVCDGERVCASVEIGGISAYFPDDVCATVG